eukprot:TRINITY_DN29189_c0_g1_i1.p1 TRINITY_DN29189_c0_g1~~TRINITY_DN29189_c0_g1_i1.p1  ORF type:complete len:448 (+),score=102.10 TRINITY_DN29189_c0_g1_i1:102-1445(+)
MEAQGMALLRRLTGTREGCFFDERSPYLDVSVICHGSHGVGLEDGEELQLAVRDLRRREAEQLVPENSPCHLKSMELDATIFLRAWASAGESRGMRVLGEVRIPLARLVTPEREGLLYHTWITLDNPGLYDSVASIGLALQSDEGAEFEQRLNDGPRQLLQPKLCLTVCRTAELTPEGAFVLTRASPPEMRIAQWAPLLRSQQQHVVMGAALHLRRSQDGDRQSAEQLTRQENSLRALRDRVAEAVGATKALRRRATSNGLASFHNIEEDGDTSSCVSGDVACSLGALEAAVRQQDIDLATIRSLLATAPTSKELVRDDRKWAMPSEQVERMRGSNAQREQQIQALRAELDGVRREAARKVDAANERLQSLRSDRDEAIQEAVRLRTEARQMMRENEALEQERMAFAEQKEALLRIVEDLHQTCATAGLQKDGRRSIDSITMNFGLT